MGSNGEVSYNTTNYSYDYAFRNRDDKKDFENGIVGGAYMANATQPTIFGDNNKILTPEQRNTSIFC